MENLPEEVFRAANEADHWHHLEEKADRAKQRAKERVLEALEAGWSENYLAKVTGISRMTIRVWNGKATW